MAVVLKRIREWAADLGVGVKTLKNAIALGQLKAVQTGEGVNSPWRCTEEQIRDWLESRENHGRRP